MASHISRREAIRLGTAGLVATAAAGGISGVSARADAVPDAPVATAKPIAVDAPPRPFLTCAKDFNDVSRGHPNPASLKGDDAIKARLTADSWRLEIIAEEGAQIQNSFLLDKGTALDMAALLKLGEKHGVRFLKAMQCNNIELPLGQGLWEGVPLRDVLGLCGTLTEVRRVYYWGFHNDDEKQLFQSSMAINQVFDTPPGDLPPFVAYRLNGQPIPPNRGGPVRMVVPWAHGFKSIKWLQKIVLTNNPQANDTYAKAKNDPESYLKTAAYFDDSRRATFAVGRPIVIRGTAMAGWPGLERVEYWVRPGPGPGPGAKADLPDSDPAWATATWKPAGIDPPPANWGGDLPDGVLPKDIWGFDAQGQPKHWPMRFSIAHWTAILPDLAPGDYEMRVRSVDQNGFAQPLPRPTQRNGRNRIECKPFTVT